MGATVPRGRQHQGRPAGQRDEHLLEGRVEGRRGELRTRSAALIWYSAETAPMTQARLAWLTATAFGAPVDPEV